MFFLWFVFLQLVIFGVLILFLRVIFTRNLTNATSHLQALNADYTQKLEEARQKKLEADKYYDETLLKAKVDAEKTKMQILREAQESQEASVNGSRKQSEEILNQARNARAELLKEIDDQIEKRSLERAGDLVREVLPQEIDRVLHDRWVELLLTGGLDELARLNVPESVTSADIASPYPLSPAQKSALQKKLKERLHREFTLHEETLPELLAGLRVKLGSLVIDGSLRFKIQETVRHAARPG